jgi:hypothetical protein
MMGCLFVRFSVGVVSIALSAVVLMLIAVLIVLAPRRCPGCLKCINVGTLEMRLRLNRLAQAGNLTVVEHVMALLAVYMMFVAAAIVVSLAVWRRVSDCLTTAWTMSR